jgi:hypothetical protein
MEVQDETTGRFGPETGNYMYNHAIAVAALCETYGASLTDRALARKTLHPLTRAVRGGVAFLLETQRPEGGWGYTRGSDGADASVSAWPVAALASALRMKLVPASHEPAVEKALARAGRWYDALTETSGAVGYRARGQYKTGPHAMTAVALYCRDSFPQQASAERTARQARIVVARDPAAESVPDLYFWYYAAFGLRLTDRDAFGETYPAIARVVVGLQREDGSFPRRTRYGEYGGTLYATAMALLILEAPYR